MHLSAGRVEGNHDEHLIWDLFTRRVLAVPFPYLSLYPYLSLRTLHKKHSLHPLLNQIRNWLARAHCVGASVITSTNRIRA